MCGGEDVDAAQAWCEDMQAVNLPPATAGRLAVEDAPDMVYHLGRKGFEDSLERTFGRSVHTVALHQPVVVARTEQEVDQLADTRSVVAAAHPFDATSSVDRTVREVVVDAHDLGHYGRLPDVRVRLLACAGSLLPSCGPSTPSEFLAHR